MSLLHNRADKYGTCLLVTHGLTIRLFLMAIFNWSVATFETVFNIGNCHHIVLKKDPTSFRYNFFPEESYPPHRPFATRKIWLLLKSLVPDARTKRKLEALRKFRDSQAATSLGWSHTVLSDQGNHLPYTLHVVYS